MYMHVHVHVGMLKHLHAYLACPTCEEKCTHYMYMLYALLPCAYMYCFVVSYRVEAQSKTLPSSPKIMTKAAAEEKEKKKTKHASADDESSPKHFALAKLFRRKDKGRSHSIQEYDMKQREEKKSGKKGAKISFPMRSKDTLSVVSACTCIS